MFPSTMSHVTATASRPIANSGFENPRSRSIPTATPEKIATRRSVLTEVARPLQRCPGREGVKKTCKGTHHDQ